MRPRVLLSSSVESVHLASATNEPAPAILLPAQSPSQALSQEHIILRNTENFERRFRTFNSAIYIMSPKTQKPRDVSDDAAAPGHDGWAEELESSSKNDTRKQPWKSSIGAVAGSQVGEGKDLLEVTKTEGGSTNYASQHFGGSLAA